MPSITITKWKDALPGLSGCGEHANSELRKRLRLGVNAPTADVRRVTAAIMDKQLVTVENVRSESVYSITQILQTLGAEFSIDLGDAHRRALFRKVPRR